MKVLYTLGRLAFGGFFLYNGINHLQNAEALAQYAAFKNVENPKEMVQLSGALLLASGASMALGLKPKWGALGALVFLGIVSPKMHDFWNQQDATQKQNETIHFAKNMALLGAALALAGAEAKHSA
jgi:putative oxidoreductase